MLSRAELYGGLIALGYYLPSLSDKSLTLNKLIALARLEVFSPPHNSINHCDIRIRSSKQMIVREITQIYTDPLPLWFIEGRLPLKDYLISILYTLDDTNQLFGKNLRLPLTRRLLKPDENCKNCMRAVGRFEKKLLLKKITTPIILSRFQSQPIGIDNDLTLVAKARLICKSRHNLVSFRRGVDMSTLKRYRFNQPEEQVLLQQEVARIDSLMDKLIALSQ